MTKKKRDDTAIELNVYTNTEGVVTAVTPSFAALGGNKSGKAGLIDKDNMPKGTVTKAKNEGRASQRYALWDWQKDILDKIEIVETAANAIEYNVRTLLGQGILYVKKSDMIAGKSNVTRHYSPEIEAFLSKNFIQEEFLVGKANDLCTLFNGFAEHIFNITRNKIVQLAWKEAEYSRVEQFSKSKGTFDRKNLYYSALFAAGEVSDTKLLDPELTAILPLYDPSDFMWLANAVKSKIEKFAVHSRPRTSRSAYYPKPPHVGLYRSKGWVDSAANVPVILNSMQNNQICLRYILLISQKYLETWIKVETGRDYVTMSPVERKEQFDSLVSKIEKKLVGTDNVWSTLALLALQDSQGNFIKPIEILPVDDKAKNDTWVPTTDHADMHITRGHMLPTSIMGIQNSNIRMNTNSGSANREGFNTVVTLNTYLQKLLLMDLQIVADFNFANGWSEWDVQFFIDDMTHTTTNNQENGIQPSDNGTKVAN